VQKNVCKTVHLIPCFILQKQTFLVHEVAGFLKITLPHSLFFSTYGVAGQTDI